MGEVSWERHLAAILSRLESPLGRIAAPTARLYLPDLDAILWSEIERITLLNVKCCIPFRHVSN